MITKLTPEQEQILVRNRDFFIKSALTFTDINRTECDKYIDWLYEFCKLDKPIKIYVSSPYAAQLAANYLNIMSNNKKGNLAKDVEDRVSAKMAGTLKEEKGEHKMVYYEFSTYVSIWYQSWYSFYKTMQDIGVKLSEDFDKLSKFNEIGIYDCIHLSGACIICERPIKVIRANGRLHNPAGSAIEWRDGYKLYFINGRCLPPWIWEKSEKGEITKEMFLTEKNAEIRGGIYAVMGQKRVASLLDTQDVDTRTVTHYYGKETITLVKTRSSYAEIGDVPFAWVRVTCPSTSTEYMLGVQPHFTNALEALASTSPLKSSEYKLNNAS